MPCRRSRLGALLTASVLAAGCGTLTTQLSGRYYTSTRTTAGGIHSGINNVFSGSVHDVKAVRDLLASREHGAAYRFLGFWFYLIDFPLSLALDAVLLPVTIPRQLSYGNLYDSRADDALAQGVALPLATHTSRDDGSSRPEDASTSGRAEGAFADGLATGIWSHYYPDGRLEKRGAYVRGVPSGQWEFWHANGMRAGVVEFVDGEPAGPGTRWTRDGRPAPPGASRRRSAP